MINRRFDDRAPCLAWMSPKQALAGKPRIHSPASGIGGHESVTFHKKKREFVRFVTRARVYKKEHTVLLPYLLTALFNLHTRE